MEDSNGFNIIPKAVDAAIQGVTDPPAKEIGKTFEDLIYLATGPIHFAADKRRARYEAGLEEFKKGLTQKVQDIPPENLVAPKLQVIGPALEDAKYCLESESIRDMFENLLAKAADSRYQSQVHPSFSQIIKQMSPLDAENLKYIKPKTQLLVVEYRLMNASHGGYSVVQTNVFLANLNTTDDIPQQALSLAALQHLGLISIRYDEWLKNDALYTAFTKTPFYLQFKASTELFRNAISSLGEFDLPSTLSMQKGLVTLTPVGEAFYQVCLV